MSEAPMPVEVYVGIASGDVVCARAKLLKVHKMCYERNKEIESAEREWE
jgi:aminoglycoside N3'-acetyltransferase